MKRNNWFKDAIILLLVIILYVSIWSAYYSNLINSFVFIAFLLLLFIIFLLLSFIYRKEKKLVRRFAFSMVLVILLISYEYRLIYYEQYTYIVNSTAEPMQVTEDSGIHILAVRSFEVPFVKDENLIIESYERQFQPVISIEKITNKDRYRSKNSELLSKLGFIKGNFAIMRENVTEYLGGDTASIADFLNREDIEGDSAGLGLALSALINKLDITNNLDFGVTGALHSNGEVMAVGSIREKLISSEENGFPFVILPTSNKQEAIVVKEEHDLNLDIIPVFHIEEAIKKISEFNTSKK